MTNKSKAERKAQHEALIVNTLSAFEEHYGRDDTKLAAWQTLCRDVGVDVGASLTQCRNNLKGIYINIFDFIKAKEEGQSVPRFGTLKELRNYSWKNHKVFPLRRAKGNFLLRGLLVHLK